MDKIIFVGLGGAVGAMLRYLISLVPIRQGFPFLTLITNLLGALLIGFIVGFADARSVSDKMTAFLKTGVCGGFTTFSTFSLEAVNLLENEKILLSIVYIIASVSLCLVGVVAGKIMAQKAFAGT